MISARSVPSRGASELPERGRAGALILFFQDSPRKIQAEFCGADAIATLQGHRAYINALAFYPDGNPLASAGADQTIRLWDVSTRQEHALLAGHLLEVWALAFSPDGTLLASGCKDGSVCICDASPERKIGNSLVLPAKIKRACFSPDGGNAKRACIFSKTFEYEVTAAEN